MSKTKKITISGLVVSIYFVTMYLSKNFSFYQYQIRIATSLYALSYFYKFLPLPLAMANSFSNLIMGGLGMPDVIMGFLVGYLTSKIISMISENEYKKYLVGLVILLLPALLVPTYLRLIIGVPYHVLFISIFIGQITPALTGVWIVKNEDIFCR